MLHIHQCSKGLNSCLQLAQKSIHFYKQDKNLNSDSGRKEKVRVPLKCPVLSIRKGTKIAQAVAPELVSLNGNKDVVLHQILDGSRTGNLFVSAQLTIKLPLLCRGGGNAALRAVFPIC